MQAQFLEAARELVERQAELWPLVEEALGEDPYRYWMVDRSNPEQLGQTRDGQWRWAFHGLELDVGHVRDGRRVRIDFGSEGQRGVFTPDGVAQLARTSCAPWPTFPELAAWLTTPRGHPDWHRSAALCGELLASGAFVYAAPGSDRLVLA